MDAAHRKAGAGGNQFARSYSFFEESARVPLMLRELDALIYLLNQANQHDVAVGWVRFGALPIT
ncbi:MAG: hypothetical protein ACLFTU_10915 [Puniceicoccaceae bacterium]